FRLLPRRFPGQHPRPRQRLPRPPPRGAVRAAVAPGRLPLRAGHLTGAWARQGAMMAQTPPPSTLETASLVYVCTGSTHLAKKLGVSGDWLVLVCVLAGALYAYLQTYQPALFGAMSKVVLASATSGNVSLLKSLAQTMGGSSGE